MENITIRKRKNKNNQNKRTFKKNRNEKRQFEPPKRFLLRWGRGQKTKRFYRVQTLFLFFEKKIEKNWGDILSFRGKVVSSHCLKKSLFSYFLWTWVLSLWSGGTLFLCILPFLRQITLSGAIKRENGIVIHLEAK